MRINAQWQRLLRQPEAGKRVLLVPRESALGLSSPATNPFRGSLPSSGVLRLHLDDGGASGNQARMLCNQR